MKNITAVFRHDLGRVQRNMIALIVLFGVVVIPSFFAWFNVISSWDPFGNVDNLKVAVANADEGYTSDLFPMKVNVGEQVLSTLRANSDLNWVFTTPQEAVEGTKSGEYYAALVLPKDFSQRMMTFLAPGAKPTQIEYYTNEKENALSPKITGEAATEVSTQINETFTKTLNNVGLSLISALADNLQKPATKAALVQLHASVSEVAQQLHSGAGTAEMFGALIGSSKPLVNSAVSLTDASVKALHNTAGTIANGANAASSLKSTLDSATSSLSDALSSNMNSYDALATSVRSLYSSLGDQSKSAAASLNALAGQVDAQLTGYTTLRDQLDAQAQATDDPALHDALTLVVSQLDTAIAHQTALRDGLTNAASSLTKGTAASASSQQEILDLIDQAKGAIEGAQSAYTGSLQPELDQLSGTLTSINSDFLTIGDDLTSAASTLSGGSNSLLGALTYAQDTTVSVAKTLDSTASQFDKLADALQKGIDTGDLSEVTKLLGNSPATLAAHLTEPVGLKTIPVFKVDTFGAQMAPFYTVLGLWIGALLLSVLIRADVVRESLPSATPLTQTQEYFGRFGIFAILAFLQSTLLYTGLIVFVGVRPVEPALLILAGWVMSLVFSLITYTLVITFGEAGKAVSVFLLVIQISGAGGAYPISVLPRWFQDASPFLPATHATNAVRSAIAGIFDGDYWISLGWLALFIVPALLVGLVLRPPLTGLNTDLARALESTKLM